MHIISLEASRKANMYTKVACTKSKITGSRPNHVRAGKYCLGWVKHQSDNKS